MERDSRIWVAGADSLIGAAILRLLARDGYQNVIEADVDPDLRNPESLDAFFSENAPEYVFLAAGKSGGIQANQKYPADLMIDNLNIISNVVQKAHQHRV